MKKIIPFLFIAILSFSCASRKEMAYFADIEQDTTSQMVGYSTTLQPDDLLGIIINSKSEALTSDFNKGPYSFHKNMLSNGANGGGAIQTYLIDKEGFINYPIIGKIKLAGLSREEAVEKLTQHIKPYIDDASINMRILNFRITVQGEVNKPGVYTIDSERVTLLQALAMAGDMTISGKRNHIVLIREQQGTRHFKIIDITSPEFMNSEYYFLQQNDVVYVEPSKTKMNSSKVGANTSAILSALSLTLAVISLIINKL